MTKEQCTALIERLADKKVYEKHGMHKTRVYGCWAAMKDRFDSYPHHLTFTSLY